MKGKFQMSKKDIKNNPINLLNVLENSELFELLKSGVVKKLEDKKSGKGSYMPIKVNDEKVYISEPDKNKELIPNAKYQKSCDFLIFCQNKLQTCFIELKGTNITTKSNYNAYDQISSTIKFLENKSDLKDLVNNNVEKHAFIVSPEIQKIPKGIEMKERQLWKILKQKGKESDYIHYVKVTKSDRYSNKNKKIICSSSSPVQIPFNN